MGSTSLAPRLLAAFGSDRGRFEFAAEMQQLAGIAPVTEKSGTGIWIHWRLARSNFKWVRIIFRCWKTRTPYDETVYCNSLKLRRSPLAAELPADEKLALT